MDMSDYHKENNVVRYLLTCIDLFSVENVTMAFKDSLDEGILKQGV